MILPSGLQYTLKRVGPKTDPCGTPYLTRLQQERELFTQNISKFNKILSQVDWKPIYDDNKISRAFLLFQNEFRNTFESCFPMKKVKIKYDNRAPYLSKGLKQSIKNIHLLWQKYEKNSTTENKNNYLKFRNKLTGL